MCNTVRRVLHCPAIKLYLFILLESTLKCYAMTYNYNNTIDMTYRLESSCIVGSVGLIVQELDLC